MVGPTFFHSLQFVTKRIITVFFKKRERERVDKQTLRIHYISTEEIFWTNLGEMCVCPKLIMSK
jgi:dTDP-D-glucose 4,6-dehydratase